MSNSKNWGGARNGAGRKPAHTRSGSTIKTAIYLLDTAQPTAAQKLIEGLDAVKEEARIVGRDKKGNPKYEYKKVPDHFARLKAAIAILNKRIPDVSKIEGTLDVEFKPVVISVEMKNALGKKDDEIDAEIICKEEIPQLVEADKTYAHQTEDKA